ncbi:hypothetical protein ASE04_09605 [Rhizobium sp. Root708]|uniref:hypothetical protein n=1 Tax=Rhizobium sp. Root708 TaxID=1736592 RepID=UPI0006FE25F4|nr:hypothetical protein [Rhizobium sp. Root708]KRB51779.1 hypothetical protein ASE04_09605 [Rhizobium sp. Root708]
MTSIGDVIKIGAGAVVGGLLVFTVYSSLNALWWLPAAERHGREIEAAEATAATNKAIGELSNAADQARVRRRLCIERGGMYNFAKGECIEAKPVDHD